MALTEGRQQYGSLIEYGVGEERKRIMVFDCELLGLHIGNSSKTLEQVAVERGANVFIDCGYDLYALLKADESKANLIGNNPSGEIQQEFTV